MQYLTFFAEGGIFKEHICSISLIDTLSVFSSSGVSTISSIRLFSLYFIIPVVLIPSPETIFYSFRTGHTQRVDITDKCPAWLIYDMPVRRGFGYSVCVYPATLSSSPFPSREVPALLLLTAQQVVDRADHTLKELLHSGAEIIEQRPVPRYAIIKPFGTAEILKMYTSDKLPLISSTT